MNDFTHFKVRLVEITADYAGQRIDNFLMRELRSLPRSRIYKLVRSGEVRVNKGRIKSGYRLQLKDIVRIPPVMIKQTPVTQKPSVALVNKLSKCVLFENDEFIVLNKPSGVAVHAGSEVDYGVIEIMKHQRDGFLELVHRLDRETSGCLLLAKSRQSLLALQEMFKKRELTKKYRMVVKGCWPKKNHTIKLPLLVTDSGHQKVKVDGSGKYSETRFKILNSNKFFSYLEADLATGRTHQIRVHTQSMGYPIIGDDRYGDFSLNKKLRKSGVKRLLLHASELSFKYPEKQPWHFKSPVPQDMSDFIKSNV